MAITNFQPEIWSERILQAFDKSFVYKNRCNTNYEGEITRMGDTVNIQSVSSPTISTAYAAGSTIAKEENLTDSQTVLQINKTRTFNFFVDDIDRAQSMPGLMDEGVRKAGVGVANGIDSYLASLYVDAKDSSVAKGILGTSSTGSVQIKSTDAPGAIKALVTAGRLLNERSVPSEGRWAIVTPYFHQVLLYGHAIQGGGFDMPNDGSITNGFVGRSLGFDVYVSNNVPTGKGTGSSAAVVTFGTNDAITYAGQLTNIEARRSERRFADAVRGLYLFGAKVVQPTAIAKFFYRTT
jgi:hypothetical protein